MRWNVGKQGDTRIVSGFLWLPKCANYEWRWLERATWHETYTRCYGDPETKWRWRHWVNEARERCDE